VSDNDQSAGAMPAAGGATPPQSPPATPPAADPPAAPTPPATGDDGALGDSGKLTLEKERTARKAAEKAAADAQRRIEELELATKSDTEKAIAQAKKEGADEVTARWSAQVRRSEVKAALTGAGINASVLDLAVNAAEFAALKVTEDGDVEGLSDAIKAFKAAKPDLFTKPATPGSADGGAHGSGKTLTRDQLKTMSPAEITAALDKGELKELLTPGRR
jgi:hypothetical protein